MTGAARRGRHAAPRRPGRLLGKGRPGWRGTSLAMMRGALLVVVGAPVLVSAGTAYAHWTSSGVGSAEAATAIGVTLSVTASPAEPAQLYPGAHGDIAFVVANPTSSAVRLTALTAATVISSHEAGCPGATSLLLDQAVSEALAVGSYALPDDIVVPAGSVASAASMEDLVTLSASAPDACQGASFAVTLTFTGMRA
ncbi:MAG: hypothetical protein JWM40_2995 [Frankiales bacterium]|nr:hypothetical protein [Frankiales bacterium]